jgi:glycosyltransferase involved in cell wall biosynthesis
LRVPAHSAVSDYWLNAVSRSRLGAHHMALRRKRPRPSPTDLADQARDAGQWGVAAQYYELALKRDPELPDIWVQYGHALKESGRVAQAEAAYRTALAYKPAAADTHLQLGHALKLESRPEEAQAAYLRALVRDPLLPYPREELRSFGWSEAELAELCGLAEGRIDDEASGEIAVAPPSAAAGGALADIAVVPVPAAHETLPLAPAPELDWARDFDEGWYLARYPDVADAGMEPFEHFIKHGLHEGRAPNARAGAADVVARFDADWYAAYYTDVLQSRMDPLEHFLKYGLQERRKPNAEEAAAGAWRPVADAEIHCLKEPTFTGEVALFVTHSPHGRLKAHVRHYLDCLRRHGVAAVLIVAADEPFLEDDADLVDAVGGLFVRANEGYDFAGWAHVLRLHPELFNAEILYLANDSLIGPVNDARFAYLLQKIRSSAADLVGLTENYERGWHIQSYFLALKRRALSSSALHKFINDIVSYEDKEDVINSYETKIAPYLKDAGFYCEAVFHDGRNPTIYHWKYLIEAGFPFVKANVVGGAFAGIDISDWQGILAGRGYDASLAERTLAEAKAPPRLPDGLGLRRPALAQPPAWKRPHDLKISFIGPWNYSNGLGVASRGYVSALRHAGFPVNFHPVKKAFHIHQQVGPAFDISDFDGPADVAIVHLNPDGWPALLTDAQRKIIYDAKLSIGLWVWEMAVLPDNWFPFFDQVGAIWSPSRYCADIFLSRAKVPVEVVPHVVPLPCPDADPTQADHVKQGLGLSPSDRIILYAFDGSSYLVRKNPFALLHAFARSGLGGEGWRLVLKAKHLYDSPAQGERLRQEVDRAQGAVLIDRLANVSAMSQLMQAADIYASPHCSEGFGLTIAEAMAKGKLVIATDYGGSADFLDAQCGFPVPYHLRTLDDDYGHYTRDGGVWAHIDEDRLTEALIAAAGLVAAGDLRRGEMARRRIGQRFSPAAVAARMRDSILRLAEQAR